MKRILTISTALALLLTLATLGIAAKSKPPKVAPAQTLLELDNGRKLQYLRSFGSEKDVHPTRSFLHRVLDVVAGPPEWHQMLRPYAITSDSRARIIVTDPGALGVHIYDFAKKKYEFLSGGKGESFASPIGVATDSADNIYVTDSQLGKIFVFDANGKFRRFVGALKNGEGFFKRPTGIAIDRAAGRIYVSDTWKQAIYILDTDGNVLKHFGSRGNDPGQFNLPTEVVLKGDDLIVVDAMNFRVQMFDKDGGFKSGFGNIGGEMGRIFRPKGIGADASGNLYLVDAIFETVQVFNRQGQLLFNFGHTGNGNGEFDLPSGLYIDAQDNVYVADSYNHRVQVFHLDDQNRVAGEQH